jgi:hypothetical protein
MMYDIMIVIVRNPEVPDIKDELVNDLIVFLRISTSTVLNQSIQVHKNQPEKKKTVF